MLARRFTQRAPPRPTLTGEDRLRAALRPGPTVPSPEPETDPEVASETPLLEAAAAEVDAPVSSEPDWTAPVEEAVPAPGVARRGFAAHPVSRPRGTAPVPLPPARPTARPRPSSTASSFDPRQLAIIEKACSRADRRGLLRALAALLGSRTAREAASARARLDRDPAGVPDKLRHKLAPLLAARPDLPLDAVIEVLLAPERSHAVAEVDEVVGPETAAAEDPAIVQLRAVLPGGRPELVQKLLRDVVGRQTFATALRAASLDARTARDHVTRILAELPHDVCMGAVEVLIVAAHPTEVFADTLDRLAAALTSGNLALAQEVATQQAIEVMKWVDRQGKPVLWDLLGGIGVDALLGLGSARGSVEASALLDVTLGGRLDPGKASLAVPDLLAGLDVSAVLEAAGTGPLEAAGGGPDDVIATFADTKLSMQASGSGVGGLGGVVASVTGQDAGALGAQTRGMDDDTAMAFYQSTLQFAENLVLLGCNTEGTTFDAWLGVTEGLDAGQVDGFWHAAVGLVGTGMTEDQFLEVAPALITSLSGDQLDAMGVVATSAVLIGVPVAEAGQWVTATVGLGSEEATAFMKAALALGATGDTTPEQTAEFIDGLSLDQQSALADLAGDLVFLGMDDEAARVVLEDLKDDTAEEQANAIEAIQELREAGYSDEEIAAIIEEGWAEEAEGAAIGDGQQSTETTGCDNPMSDGGPTGDMVAALLAALGAAGDRTTGDSPVEDLHPDAVPGGIHDPKQGNTADPSGQEDAVPVPGELPSLGDKVIDPPPELAPPPQVATPVLAGPVVVPGGSDRIQDKDAEGALEASIQAANGVRRHRLEAAGFDVAGLKETDLAAAERTVWTWMWSQLEAFSPGIAAQAADTSWGDTIDLVQTLQEVRARSGESVLPPGVLARAALLNQVVDAGLRASVKDAAALASWDAEELLAYRADLMRRVLVEAGYPEVWTWDLPMERLREAFERVGGSFGAVPTAATRGSTAPKSLTTVSNGGSSG